MIPGEYRLASGELELNAGRERVTLVVTNLGDRPVQVGSHTHFYETNLKLSFDRKQAYGFRLDIPAGTALRFEPNEGREVTLVAFAGARQVYGMNALVHGDLDEGREQAQAAGVAGGFEGIEGWNS